MRPRAPPRLSRLSVIHSTAPRAETLLMVTKNSGACSPCPHLQAASPAPEATRDQELRTSLTKARNCSYHILSCLKKPLKCQIFFVQKYRATKYHQIKIRVLLKPDWYMQECDNTNPLTSFAENDVFLIVRR